jgi:hypothetical protein
VVGSHIHSSHIHWGSLRSTQAAFVAERLRRYVQVVVNFVGVGSIPTECKPFFLLSLPPSCFFPFLFAISASTMGRCAILRRSLRGGSREEAQPTHAEEETNQKGNKKCFSELAVPGFEPGSSGSQPLMLTTTLYHQNTYFYSQTHTPTTTTSALALVLLSILEELTSAPGDHLAVSYSNVL